MKTGFKVQRHPQKMRVLEGIRAVGFPILENQRSETNRCRGCQGIFF